MWRYHGGLGVQGSHWGPQDVHVDDMGVDTQCLLLGNNS